MAACADGFRNPKYTKARTKKDPLAQVAQQPEAPSPMAVSESAAPLPSAQSAREELETLIASLPEDSPQRAAIALLLERDAARTRHAEDEKSLQDKTGNPDARLPVPTIIRDRSEDKGRVLESQLMRVMADAGRTLPTEQEAMITKAAMASILPERERKAVAEIMATAPLPGSQKWLCRNPACGKVFEAAPMEEVRRYSKEHQDWKFVCTVCKSPRVELFVLESVA